MHAGWPKYAQRAVGSDGEGTPVVSLWAPLTATTPRATVTIATDYPFGDVATVTVAPRAAGGASAVLLRIPSWAGAGTFAVDGGAARPLRDAAGTFLRVPISPSGASVVALDFAPAVRLEPAYGGAFSVHRGALLYAAWIGQTITVTATHAFESRDLDVRAAAPWALALVVRDADAPGADLVFARAGPPSALPFNSTAVPVTIAGRARVVAAWGADKNAPAAPPPSPACAAAGACSDAVDVVLVPFGSTHVRMAVMPLA
jgi:DUF1680 family protein